LLALDPKHPAALEVSSLLNSSFRRQAEEARRLTEDARQKADKAGGGKSETFATAAELVKEADRQYKRGSFAEAARSFLESRDAFEKARRAALATPVPAPPVAAAVPAQSQAPTAPPTAPPAPVVAARRAFSLGPSVVQSKSAGSGLAGFEGASVQKASDLRGTVAIEVEPAEVRPGDTYQLVATFTNTGRKTIKLKEATVTFTVNGTADKQSVTPDPIEVLPQQTTSLTRTGGVWEEGVEAWSLQVTVASDKGDVWKREIKLK
jgi:hypothetical protein